MFRKIVEMHKKFVASGIEPAHKLLNRPQFRRPHLHHLETKEQKSDISLSTSPPKLAKKSFSFRFRWDIDPYNFLQTPKVRLLVVSYVEWSKNSHLHC